jgi:hypothetical protein
MSKIRRRGWPSFRRENSLFLCPVVLCWPTDGWMVPPILRMDLPIQSTNSHLNRPTQKNTLQNQTTGEEKARKQKVTLIQLHTIKPLINIDNYMTGINTYLSILTMNVNRLNSPIKRH